MDKGGSKRRGGVEQYRIPFDVGSASDEEVFTALSDRKVTWENSISGQAETDVVRENGFRYRTDIAPDGERVFSFLGQNGYRSFRLSSLRRVH